MTLHIQAAASALTDAMLENLAEWKTLSAWLATAKEQELTLRNTIAQHFFPAPKEGVNKIKLPDNEVLVMTHKINRTLDEAALDAVMQEFPEDSPFRNLGVLIKYKPVLVVDGLRALNESDALIFAQALTEKPGTPSLDIVPDKTSGEEAPPDWPATRGVQHANIEPKFDHHNEDNPRDPSIASTIPKTGKEIVSKLVAKKSAPKKKAKKK